MLGIEVTKNPIRDTVIGCKRLLGRRITAEQGLGSMVFLDRLPDRLGKDPGVAYRVAMEGSVFS